VELPQARFTRDFHPFPLKLGHVRRVTFSFIIHRQNRSIPSQHEYVFIEGSALQDERAQRGKYDAIDLANRLAAAELELRGQHIDLP
jgi:hypothetical protein